MGSFLRDREAVGDDGYALVSVIGLGTAILLSVGAVSAYSLQAMGNAGSTQGFHASIQAAQAGVDQFASKLNTAVTAADVTTAINAGTTWQAIPGSQDGAGASCAAVSGGSLPANCPTFRYTVTANGSSYDITSTGYSRGDVRSVKVTLRQRSLTDYLYYSETEAADPNDRFVYPNIPLLGLNGAPANCGNKAWAEGAAAARPNNCVVPKWRTGDATFGSRVHTRDVFGTVGSPSFDSAVSAAIPSCASAPTTCVTGTGSPSYGQGTPSYADDLIMPSSAALLTDIAAAAVAPNGCTYIGPTRIKFLEGADAGKMQVWSPMSAYFLSAAEQTRCLGAAPTNLLGLSVSVNVHGGPSGNAGAINGLVTGLFGLTCATLNIGCPATVNLSVSNILGGNLLGDLAGALPLFSPPPVAIPGAIYIKDATTPPPGLTTAAQCLLGSAAGVGLYQGDVSAALNNGLLAPSDCTKGNLSISGKLKGKTTIGGDGSITILSDLTYTDRSTDRLGLVARGPVQVYNSVQCVLSIGTCLSLNSLSGLLPSLTALLANPNPTQANLTSVLNSLGVNNAITVEAAIVTNSRFGVQLPLLSTGVSVSLLNRLISLNIDPPTLTLRGSVAQRYRGLTSADLVSLAVSGGVLGAAIDVASANVDIGYRLKLEYDGKLRTDPPLYLPKAGAARFDQVSFAEIAAVH